MTTTTALATLDLQPTPGAPPPRPPRRQRGRSPKSSTRPAEAAKAAETHSGTTLTPAERAERAWRLRLAGWTWERIAGELGWANRSVAHQAAMRYALLVNPPDEASRAAVRARMLAQLDALFGVIESDLAPSADPLRREAAMERALRMIEMHARWTGLAPSATPLAQRIRRHGLAIKP